MVATRQYKRTVAGSSLGSPSIITLSVCLKSLIRSDSDVDALAVESESNVAIFGIVVFLVSEVVDRVPVEVVFIRRLSD